MYDVATAVVRVSTKSGTQVVSRPVSIDRGVLQGDGLSPRLFIIAVASIMLKHDLARGGIVIDGLLIDRLEYADDAALLDTTIKIASERITRLGQAFPDDGDMAVSVPKTKVMQVEELEKVKVTEEDVAKATEQDKLPFQCEFCFRRFATKVDQRHYKHCGPAQRVVWDGEWEVAKILDVRGSVDERWYLVGA